jgi:hypothetical protein
MADSFPGPAPEQARSMMTAIWQGWERGRATAQVTAAVPAAETGTTQNQAGDASSEDGGSGA